MNEVQSLQLGLLSKLDTVCKKHNLKYYLAYGTCIGAVRHKGFIPWDHDVDVLMPFDDARKLAEFQDEFAPSYYVSNYLNDQKNLTVKVLLCDRSHKCNVMQNGEVLQTNDLCMDIYPYYNCPPTTIGLILNIWRSHVYKVLVGGIPLNHGLLAKILGKMVLLIASKGNKKKAISKLEEKLNYKGKSYEIADYYGLDVTFMSAITYKKDWFSEPTELEFEGKIFYGPTDPDKYLSKRYGDYMTPISKMEIEKEVKIELAQEDR